MDNTEGRRVFVTGHDRSGKAVFVGEETTAEMELAGRDVRAGFIWGRDDTACFPDDGRMPAIGAGPMPGPGAFRVSTLTIAAGKTRAYHQIIAHLLGEFAEQEHPGFHRTPTLDVIVVLAGSFVLELDDGEQRRLDAGDTAILNGVRHRWHNQGNSDATLLAVVMGANDRRSR